MFFTMACRSLSWVFVARFRKHAITHNLLIQGRLQCVQQNLNFDPKQGYIPFYIKKGIRELLFFNGLYFTHRLSNRKGEESPAHMRISSFTTTTSFPPPLCNARARANMAH